MSDEIAVTEKNDTPGSRLLQAREGLGLSQKAVADELHLPRNYIQWIEEEAYEKLPSIVFCRGYIRAYAKIVKEDGESLIELLDQKLGTTKNPKGTLNTVSKIDAQVKVGDPVMKWPTLVFVVALAGVVFWWWQTQYGLTEETVSQQAPVSVETANGNELLLPGLDDSLPDLETELTPPQVVTQAPVVVQSTEQLETISTGESVALALDLQEQPIVEEAGTEQLAEIVAALEPVEEAPAIIEEAPVVTGPASLKVSFKAECWVTIKDSTGKTVFNGLKTAGTELDVTGKEPLRVSIGRVDAVADMSYAGVTVDLSKISRNNIANFNLPL